jgi:hypothetical protein
MVVKYTLPVETVDQLRHVLFENPMKDTWASFVKRKVFTRAEEIATAIREAKLQQALSRLGLRPKTSNPEVVSSVYNLFDNTVVNVNVSKGDETTGDLRLEESEGVTFYSNCAHASKMRAAHVCLPLQNWRTEPGTACATPSSQAATWAAQPR